MSTDTSAGGLGRNRGDGELNAGEGVSESDADVCGGRGAREDKAGCDVDTELVSTSWCSLIDADESLRGTTRRRTEGCGFGMYVPEATVVGCEERGLGSGVVDR